MPFPRSSIPDRIRRLREDIAQRVGLPAVPEAGNVSEIGAAVVGETEELHLHLLWVLRQMFPQTADAEGLELRGAFRQLPRLEATAATGEVRINGTNGVVIPLGQEIRRKSDLRVYKTTAAVTIAGGYAVCPVVSVVRGLDGAVATGSLMAVTSPPTGAERTATVLTTGLGGGSDVETDDAYRERLLTLERNPPAGGRKSDWERWAREIPGVTRVWAVPNYLEVHHVGVFFTTDNDPGGPIPPATKVAQLQLIFDDRKPLTSEAFALAPTALPVDYTLSISPDTASMRALVLRELGDLHRNQAAVGADEDNGELKLKTIRFALGAIDGLLDYTLTAPAANVTPDPHELPTLGTVTFT